MSILMNLGVGNGAMILIIGSFCVIVAAIFPPKEYKGEGKSSKSSDWDESIEDV